MFCLPHLAVLLFTAVFVPFCCKKLQGQMHHQIGRLLKIAAIVVLFFDPAYWLWEWKHFASFNLATTLPLYICSLFWIMLPVAAFARPGIFRQIAMANICTVGLLGGIFGLVFNVYVGQYPFFSFIPIRSLLYHFIMVLVCSVLWATGYYQPKPADRYLCMVPLAVLMIPCLWLNRLYGWDYCYTGGGTGTPLEILSSHVPIMVFLFILYGSLAAVINLIFYRRFFKCSSIEFNPEESILCEK